jgi:hypothetical protein
MLGLSVERKFHMELAISRYHDSVVYGGATSTGIESRTNCDLVRGVNSAIGSVLQRDEMDSGNANPPREGGEPIKSST